MEAAVLKLETAMGDAGTAGRLKQRAKAARMLKRSKEVTISELQQKANAKNAAKQARAETQAQKKSVGA